MTDPTRTHRRFTALQEPEAIGFCLQEGFSCSALAQPLGRSSSSLVRWVRQARIDRGQAGPRDQNRLSSEERAELNRLRKENHALRRKKDRSGWRPADDPGCGRSRSGAAEIWIDTSEE